MYVSILIGIQWCLDGKTVVYEMLVGKFGGENVSSIWRKKCLANDRSAKGLLIVMTTLYGFSLSNCRQFAKFAKLSCYTVYRFPPRKTVVGENFGELIVSEF